MYKRQHIGLERQQRLIARGLLGLPELFFLDDEWDDAHARELVALAYSHAALARGDHHLVLAIHGDKARGIDQKHAVTGGLELDLALFHAVADHVFLPAELSLIHI